MVLAIAALFAPVMAGSEDTAYGGDGGVDILDDGIFETDGSAFSFPVGSDTNYDAVEVGNDKAIAFGSKSGFPFGFRNGPANAQNNLEIKKNQDSGKCRPCVFAEENEFESELTICDDACLKMNIEQIEVGNREALAFGLASATNNIKLVTNQQ